MLQELNNDELVELAGKGAFERGLVYFQKGKVSRLECDLGEWRARVKGSSVYHVQLREDDEGVHWHCDCPAAADGGFCKHLVALALAAQALASQEPAEKKEKAVTEENDLLVALKQQSADTLANWLHDIARNDEVLEQSLRVRLSLLSPSALKEVLQAALRTGGFLDYRRSLDYAQQLGAPLTLLAQVLDSAPQECASLCEYAIKRLLKIYERADDSAGAIGDRSHEFAGLHAQAIRRSVEQGGEGGRKLATSLHKLKLLDQWGLFPLGGYWASLGKDGQIAYASKVEKEYQTLPPPPSSLENRRRHFYDHAIIRRREEVAYEQGDFDTLVRLYSRDLSYGRAYEQLVEACRHFGREAEAMSWAERGARIHPDSVNLYRMLSEEYSRAGLDEEAQDALWRAFQKRREPMYWHLLKNLANTGWPAWRERALAFLTEREVDGENGRDVTTRVSLLMEDGDLPGAVTLARAHHVDHDILDALAKKSCDAFPAEAAAFWRRCVDGRVQAAQSRQYSSLVRLMKKARDCDPSEATAQWLEDLRERYRRRTALIERMDKAKLW